MVKRLLLNFMLGILFVLKCDIALAQNTFGSEDELKKQANKLFSEDEFVKAYPLFSQLLALYQNNYEYNYKLGVCMLFASAEKEKAIPYLEYAVKYKDIDDEAFYYMGLAYHLNYRFNDAVVYYEKFKTKVSGRKVTRLNVDRQIEMCENGKKLLKNIMDIKVLDKKELNRVDFFRSYNLAEFNAKLIVTPEEFLSAYDKKKKENNIMYLEQGKDVIFFSSYGTDGKNGKDIFVKKKLPNGDWSEPQNIGYPVNSPYDEDYPFLHPNGKILYFCSKGHNSMGGYDVFKSELNVETGTWLKPVNLDFAVNTPDDDIMFVSDMEDKYAYFATTRSSSGNQIAVYKIIIDKKPLDYAIVKGTVKVAGGGISPSVKIMMKNVESGKQIGMFNSKEGSGDYILNLPNGGKFSMEVAAPGFNPYKTIIEIPVLYELKPLVQEIQLIRLDNGNEQIKVVNKFDENISDADYLYAMEFLKQKAKLEINYTKQDSLNDVLALNKEIDDEINSDKEDKEEKQNKDKSNFSTQDLITMSYNDAKESQKDANELRKNADNAANLTQIKKDELEQKESELKQQENLITSISDANQKQNEIEKKNQLENEINTLKEQYVLADKISNKLDENAKTAQSNADLSLTYAKDLERVMSKTNPSTTELEELEKKKDLLEEKQKQDLNSISDITSTVTEKYNNVNTNYTNIKNKIEAEQEEIKLLESEIEKTSKDAEKEKNKDLKQSMLDQVVELKEELDSKKKSLTQKQTEFEKVSVERNNLKEQNDFVESFVKETSTSTTIVSTEIKNNNSTTQQPNTVNAGNNTITSNANNSTTASNNTNSNTNNSTTTDVVSIENKISAIENKLTTIDAKYEKELEETAKMEDGHEKELAKSNINLKWAQELEKVINEIDKESLNTTDVSAKKKIEEIQNKVSAQHQEKKTTSDLQKDASVQLKSQEEQTISANNNNLPDNTTASSSVEEFKKEKFDAIEKNNSEFNVELEKISEIENTQEKKEKEQILYKEHYSKLEDTKKELQDYVQDNPHLNASDKIALQEKINVIEKTQKEIKAKIDNENVVASSTNPVNSVNSTTGNIEVIKKQSAVNDNTYLGWEEKLKSGNGNMSVSDKKEIYNEYNNRLNDEKNELQKILNSDTLNAEDRKYVADRIVTIDSKFQQNSNALSEINNQEELVSDNNSDKENNEVTDVNETNSYKNFVDNSVVYSSEVGKKELENTNELITDAKNISLKIDSLNSIAAKTTKKKQLAKVKEEIYFEEKKLAEKEIEILESVSTVNQSEYNKNAVTIEGYNSGNTKNSEAERLFKEAEKLMKDAEQKKFEAKDLSLDTKISENQDANKMEIEAIKLQLKALEMYNASGKDPVLVSNNANTNSTTNNPSQVTVTENSFKEIITTNEYKNYNNLKSDADKINKEAMTEYKTAETYKQQSVQKRNEAQKLIEQTATETDPDKIEELKSKSEKLDNESLQLLSASDSVLEIARNLEAEADAKNVEADVYVKSLDAKKTDNILTAYSNLNNKEQVSNNPVKEQPLVNEPIKESNNNNSGNNNDNNIAGNNNTVSVDNNTVPNSNPVSSTVISSLPPSVKFVDKIEIKNSPVYSKSKPIPVDEKLPEGLLFKVQVGAFRNPIPQDLFKGITPIQGESTPQGFIRYTAGVFTVYDKALEARDQIRGMGYKDAFVVAFLNGKRISFEQAMAMLENNKTTQSNNTSSNSQTVQSVNTNTVNTVNTNVQNNVTTQTQQKPVVTVINDVTSIDVTSLKGLFYTVQVGVYSKKVTSAQLFGIAPLNNEILPNGLIRYTTGNYKEVQQAVKEKERIVVLGVKDAFVTAYYNGKRITLDEAAQLIAVKGNKILDEPNDKKNENVPLKNPEKDKQSNYNSINNNATNTNPEIKNNNTSADNSNTGNNTVQVPTSNKPAINDSFPTANAPFQNVVSNEQPYTPVKDYTVIPNSGPDSNNVVFRVQIGMFKGDVPVEIANKYIRVNKQGISIFRTEDGTKFYTIGSFSSSEEANKCRLEAVDQGLFDAFVIAMKEGKKIPLSEAK